MPTSEVSIAFTDAQATTCTPQWSTSTTLVCLTGAFDAAASQGGTLSVVFTINGQTVTHSLSLTLMSNTKSGMGLSPSSANPTLKTKINITLEATFPYTLSRADFSVNATNISNPSYFRQMNVIGVNDADKTIEVMFGGAWSGLYQVRIRHANFGLLDTSGLILTVGSNVTSYYPTEGSIYGGTLLTITGTNFGKVKTDNPVQISTLGGVGSVDCFVKTIMETQITCRIGATSKTAQTSGKMLVFLKTSEEASCVPSTACAWIYTSVIPTVTNMSLGFDTTSNQYTVTVTGTSFSGNTSSTLLEIGGRAQAIASLTVSQAVFTVTDAATGSLSGMKLYFAVGTPEGHAGVMAGTHTMTPKLVSITPNTGGKGGTWIVAKVPGVGPGTTGLELTTNATSTRLCAPGTLTIPSYGKVVCRTKAATFTAGTYVRVQLGGSYYPCTTNSTGACNFTQADGAAFPAVGSTGLVKTSKTIAFTGTDFYTTGYTANASFAGIKADSVVVASATSATATWNRGVPLAAAATAPDLWFESTTTEEKYWAQMGATVANPLSVTASSSAVSCSFAGGCRFEVTASGLASQLHHNATANAVSVCGQRCSFNDTASNDTHAVCHLPAMSTVYSNANFGIARESEDLKSGDYFGNLGDASQVFDNVLPVVPTQPSTPCHVGMRFKPGHVGLLSQVKYFMGNIASKATYSGVLKFQGSDDGTTFTDLFSADDNIHEGWNYHEWTDAADKPRYNQYRFYAAGASACRINEVKFTGVETVND